MTGVRDDHDSHAEQPKLISIYFEQYVSTVDGIIWNTKNVICYPDSIILFQRTLSNG